MLLSRDLAHIMKISGYFEFRWPFLGLLLLGLHFCLSGQSEQLYLLKQRIDLSTTDSAQINLLNEIAWQTSNVNLDTSYYDASLALEKARTKDYFSGIARALNLQGLVLSYRSNSERYLI